LNVEFGQQAVTDQQRNLQPVTVGKGSAALVGKVLDCLSFLVETALSLLALEILDSVHNQKAACCSGSSVSSMMAASSSR
jgi:hypothetical protein